MTPVFTEISAQLYFDVTSLILYLGVPTLFLNLPVWTNEFTAPQKFYQFTEIRCEWIQNVADLRRNISIEKVLKLAEPRLRRNMEPKFCI